jgi:hypothetical protein
LPAERLCVVLPPKAFFKTAQGLGRFGETRQRLRYRAFFLRGADAFLAARPAVIQRQRQGIGGVVVLLIGQQPFEGLTFVELGVLVTAEL